MFHKDVVVYFGQDTSIDIQPIELDGWKPDPESLQIEGFIYRPGDDIETYKQDMIVSGKKATIPYNENTRFDYSYRYNLYVVSGSPAQRYLFQLGNVIFKNEHREPDNT